MSSAVEGERGATDGDSRRQLGAGGGCPKAKVAY